MPTTNCLVELVEPPFLVTTLNEIEVVNFERVGFNLKNFDMAIIFKDFTRDILRIDAIPSNRQASATFLIAALPLALPVPRMCLALPPALTLLGHNRGAFALK